MKNKSGFWGPVTSTLDWCEANYQFSYYIAEWANTLTNLLTICLAVWGLWRAQYDRIPLRYAVANVGFAIVGLGSFAFHATLLYECQLADELPMIYLASYIAFLLFDSGPGFAHTRRTTIMISLVACFQIFFTWSYYVYRIPAYFQIVFASFMFGLTFRSLYMLRYYPAAKQIPPHKHAELTKLSQIGLGLFAFGFLIWNLDNIYCHSLTVFKDQFGWPGALIFEGHAWWHIFTALGTYFILQSVTYLSVLLKGNPQSYSLRYTLGLPSVRQLSLDKSK